jgi:hypothetical protein
VSLHTWYFRDESTIDLDNLVMAAEDEAMRDLTDAEVADYAEREGWKPCTTCHVCDRPLKDHDPAPLCKRCRSTAEATARAFPEGHEAFKAGAR